MRPKPLIASASSWFFLTHSSLAVVFAFIGLLGMCARAESAPARASGVSQITITDVSVLEGGGGLTSLTFTLTLDPPSSNEVTVDYATKGNTATEGNNDYIGQQGSVFFDIGQEAQLITIDVNGDDILEDDETLFINLSNAAGGAFIADNQATGTIENDDAVPTVSISDGLNSEGSFLPFVPFTVGLSNPTDQPVTVDFVTKDGTALVGNNDYQAGSGQVTIPAKETSASLLVFFNADNVYELDETFLVNLSNPSGATIQDGEATGTIVNDDPFPTALVGPVALVEGNDGKTEFVFKVTLSNPWGPGLGNLLVSTEDGTATLENGDYQQFNRIVDVPAKENSTTVSVQVNGDNIFEGDEAFRLVVNVNRRITPSSGNIESTAFGDATILNDDSQPTVEVSNVSQAEGNDGKTDFVFTATLSNPTEVPVVVSYSTKDGSATLANNDYQSADNNAVIDAKQSSTTFTISVNGDGTAESDENFYVNWSAFVPPFGPTLSQGQAGGQILNDEEAPTISINDVSQFEDAGSAGKTEFVFTVSLSHAIDQPVTIGYATKDGSATLDNADYQGASGEVIIPAKQTTATISVFVNEDVLFENDESFFVNLTSTEYAFVDNQGDGTIRNDDGLPNLSINDVSQLETNSGQTAFQFTVSLSALSGNPVFFEYGTKDGSATTANSDYQSTNRGDFVPAKNLSTTITVMVNGDATTESDEIFFVNLSNVSGANVSDNQGQGTIQNDDGPPTISIDDVVKAEGNAGTTSFVFTVSLSNATDQPVIVDYSTADGSATLMNSDYQSTTGQVTIPAKSLSATLTLLVNGDTNVEPDEDFFVNLTQANGATIADNQGKGTIQNDDTQAPPSCPNLVKNPSFEKDKEYWKAVNSATLTRVSGGLHGTRALQVAGPYSRDAFGIDDYPNTIASTPAIGTTYRFSAWVKSAAHTGQARLRIKEIRSSTTYQTVLSPPVTLSPNWQELSVVVTTLRSGSTLDFHILDYTPVVKREVFLVDSIRVEKTPCTPTPQDRPPVVTAPGKVTAEEEEKLVVVVTAQDPDGHPITSFTASGLPPGATFTTNSSKTSGTLNWTPDDDDGRYESYVVTFTAKNALTGSATTAINIDDSIQPPPGGGANLCGNPSFESSLSGWKSYHDANLYRVSPGKPGSGNYVLESRGGSSEAGINDYPNWVTSTQGGKTYRYSCWVRSAFHTGQAQIKVREYQGSSSVRSTSSQTVTLSPGWKELTVDVVARYSGTTLDLQIYNKSSGQTFQIDAVSIVILTSAPGLSPPSVAVGLPTELQASLVPNPTRGDATLMLALPDRAEVEVQLFDVGGRAVRAMQRNEYEAGIHHITLAGPGTRGGPLRSGLYFYRVVAGAEVRRGRLVVVH